MEPLIRHVRFFNGQFLKQEEFREEQAYGIHMRRRVNYALFEDGVVQITPSDLTIEPVTPGKRIRIRRGMALGSNHVVLEAKEIILPEDSAIVDLATNFVAGDTVWVTVNYRETETAPVPLGSGTENSRVDESAFLDYHDENPAGTLTPDGDPLIIVGSVDFDTMTVSTADRQVATLRPSLIALVPSITLSPNEGTAGTSVTLTATSAGGLDLSTLTPGDISITPSADISGLSVSSPTANSATVTFTLGGSAAPGPRTLTITIGSVSASATFTVQSGLTLATFAGVNEPADLNLKINGSGFAHPVLVEFSATPSGFTAPVPLGPANVDATQIRIPKADIPGNATVGPVRVQSASQLVTSAFNVMPPAIIGTAPPSAVANTNITITGQRFFTGTAVILPGGVIRGPSGFPGATPPFFPEASIGESLSETTIIVRLASTTGTSAKVRITTDGGTVESPGTLNVI